MHQITHDTYNQSAGSLSRHYDEIGARDGDVTLAFSLAGSPNNAAVLELGCGNGRDARAILRHTPFYSGIDNSEKMIEIARKKVPKADFKVADAVAYEYGGPYTIIFAFALFRHLDITEITKVLKKAAGSLRHNGILYISSLYSKNSHQAPRSDAYGTREMYYYNPELIMKHAPSSLKKAQVLYDTVNGEEWFELILRHEPA